MKPSIQAHQFVLADGPSPSAPLPEGEAPPPYNTLPPDSGIYSGSSISVNPVGFPQQEGDRPPPFATGWGVAESTPPVMANFSSPLHGAVGKDTKICYMDFVPRMIKKKILQDNEYETFGTLVERANDWLEEHAWITVMSCETITWSGLKASSIYSDSSCFERSLSAAKKTKNLVGLRLWFTQDTFPTSSKSNTPTVIECRTFIPREDTESFTEMIDRVNKILVTDPLDGSIFSVEIIPVPCRNHSDYRPGCMAPNICFWQEDPEFNKVFAMCLRVYAKLVPFKDGVETIGYKNFVPQYNGQSKENKGFEVFSCVMDRASRWISSQDGVRFVSIKSLNVKLKKKGHFEERCVFTEHLCAKTRENILTGLSSTTKYLRTIRAFYVLNSGSEYAASNLPSHSASSQIRLTNRTFAPAQIGMITSSVPVNMCNPSPYEETRKVLERINQWVAITGAKVFHLETIATRQTAISQLQTLGADATFSQNSLYNSRSNVEHWIHYIRLYIDGEYREPPGAVSLVVPCVRPIV